MTISRPRGKCPGCGKSWGTTSQGRIWAHQRVVYRGGWPYKELCTGTGRRPVEDPS